MSLLIPKEGRLLAPLLSDMSFYCIYAMRTNKKKRQKKRGRIIEKMAKMRKNRVKRVNLQIYKQSPPATSDSDWVGLEATEIPV